MIGKSIRKIKLFNRIIKIEFLYEKSMFHWWVCTNEYFLTYLLHIDHQSNIFEHISNYTRILPMKYPCIHNKFRKINTNVLRETLDISRGDSLPLAILLKEFARWKFQLLRRVFIHKTMIPSFNRFTLHSFNRFLHSSCLRRVSRD